MWPLVGFPNLAIPANLVLATRSLVAADGLLNMPCFSYGCVCNYPLQTSFAMRHMPESAEWAGEKPFQLLKKKK